MAANAECGGVTNGVYNSRELRPELANGKWRDHLRLDECDRRILDTHRIELKWGTGGYVKVLAVPRGQKNQTRKYVTLARLILDAPPEMEADHINGDTLDNRRSNLRLCSRSQNTMNRGRSGVANPTGFRGVRPAYAGKWIAVIREHKRSHHLGTFDNERDAAKAYDAAARRLHGEFARPNFPASPEEVAR